MSDNKNIIDKETKKILEYADELVNLELNFRKYIQGKGLSEDSYKQASIEYSEAIKPMKDELNNIDKVLEEITEDTSFVSEESLAELNKKIGKIWRIIVLNQSFVNDYGSVSFTDEPATNLYKEIYDKHLEELNKFMYNFIKRANLIFSK